MRPLCRRAKKWTARRVRGGGVRQLTILGDGAAWIWNIATAKFSGASSQWETICDTPHNQTGAA
jgi:hypothetical protein